jgi:two-component system response regulator MprA
MKPKAGKPLTAATEQTILLVEDDAAVRETIARVLRREGFVVLMAANGDEALRIAESKSIDLVLLDLNMPVRGGWDTFEKLTSDNPLLSVIIITARPNQLFTALGAGATALLEKPFDFTRLLETVRVALEEPSQVRLARMAGRPSGFRYLAADGNKIPS